MISTIQGGILKIFDPLPPQKKPIEIIFLIFQQIIQLI